VNNYVKCAIIRVIKQQVQACFVTRLFCYKVVLLQGCFVTRLFCYKVVLLMRCCTVVL